MTLRSIFGISELYNIIFMSKLETSKMVLMLFFEGISIKFCNFFNTNTYRYHFLYNVKLMAIGYKLMDIRLEKIGKTNSLFVQKEINYKNQIIEKIVLYFDVTRKEVKNISHVEKNFQICSNNIW